MTSSRPTLRTAVPPPRRLAELVGAYPLTVVGEGGGGWENVTVRGVRADNREITGGELFAAHTGGHVHGARFARAAVDAGAAAVLTDPEGRELLSAGDPLGVPVLVADDVPALLGELAAALYGRPADRLGTFAVTGTNGKTTTVFMVEHALRALGRRTGLIGTVELRVGDRAVPATLTTPQPADLQALLATMVAEDVDDLVMEVSSHALALHRVDPVVFDVAGFTNLTQDHLDFHETLEDYFDAKADLFTPARSRRGVVLVDDEWGRRLAERSATVHPGRRRHPCRPRRHGHRPGPRLAGARRGRGRHRHHLHPRPPRRAHAARAATAVTTPLAAAEATRMMSPTATATRAGTQRPVPAEEDEGRKKSRWWVWLLALLGLAAAAGIVALIVTNEEEPPPPEMVAVPDMTGMDQVEARQELEEAGLEPSIVDDVPSDTVEEGLFVESRPAVGTEIEVGETVEIAFSSGPEAVEVPNVVGMSQDQAASALESAGLASGSVQEVNDPSAAPGDVVATDPAAGESAAPGSRVNLTVASNFADLPDLTGQTEEEASATLAGLDLNVRITQQETADAEPGTVIQQSHPAGAVERGTTVALTVAVAPPEPSPEPSETSEPPPDEPSDTAPPDGDNGSGND
ncbi:PASTA domain-containing protein [Georgenia sp. SUBG003]|uniref:PASTA domain-containing protein n=1 Tax=Georgenia sp. SUBG003 TaxID=1497974 RepID=UPI003AB90F21